MLGGVAVALAARLPDCEVIAAEPSGADDASRGFRERRWQPQRAPNTIADGLRSSVGEPNFELMLRHVKDVLVVSDAGCQVPAEEIERCLENAELALRVSLAPIPLDAGGIAGAARRSVAVELAG